MYGVMLGDIIGSPYEFGWDEKTKDFSLFCRNSTFTDDSVMTVAIGEALLMSGKDAPAEQIQSACVERMQAWGRRYPNAGYGARFIHWLFSEHPRPYNSYGNGSAMRVSAAGLLYDTLERTREVARATAVVTHDHPEGIKGAEATASIIFLARNGASKTDIRNYVVREFGYDLSRTIDKIRPGYYHVESCQRSVPEAITAFLEGTDYEDTVRNAVSLGGDADTLAAISGGMAEAFYGGIPVNLLLEAHKRIPSCMLEVCDAVCKAAAGEWPIITP